MKSSPIREPNRLDIGLMVLAAIIWASGFVAIRIAVPETRPIWLAAMRVGIGVLVLLPYGLWRGMVWPQGTMQWLLILGMAMLNVVVPFIMISWAGLTLDVSVMSLLMGTGPFLALLGSHLFTDDDRMTSRKFVSVLLGFAGIVVLVGPSAFAGLGSGSLKAQLVMLAASCCYVTAGLLIRRIRMPPVRLAALALTIGATALFPIALVSEGPPQLDLSWPAVSALVYLGVFPTGIAYILRFRLIRAIGYSRFSLTINMIPVFGMALGVLLLGEPLTVNSVLALALVLSGLYVAAGKDPSQSAAQS
ncbi:MAG: DMT family transporter [Hoeflea sp.]|uniref:DMT family transporter n=1 Tax=Hoeflea sp. TaxID=1940281 RepID=UPI0032EE5EC8